ncbi:hypothetical protein ACFQ68_18435 [Amycolatopsis japonica]|uniref:hypothetical protein n=1 Tax=Amycolatopsis japonica TaxID=208439 RepID=UPI00366CAB9E
MAMNGERVTCYVGSTLDTAQATKAAGSYGRENTDSVQNRAQGLSQYDAQGTYGQAIVDKDRRNQRLANEQWDGHDQMYSSVTNGAHSLQNACRSSINRLESWV